MKAHKCPPGYILKNGACVKKQQHIKLPRASGGLTPGHSGSTANQSGSGNGNGGSSGEPPKS